ncbi:excinuclease ABC subunit UvrC [Cerasicoccus arenae]|uniref:UvrABC system protein C n=1 Tax=Cerasicoccus arenae TaxID=424488 RepID=A0A8J3DAE2_9BACT|nr:excinuclease ABC subunit UvrC [Cerasicoccus arenae]MBK1858153.1 excinuclease ABC subunit UvrC [Cerasicoccus arenae]GHB96810.1 UvrABC system protein C [Cerasicoccus arenae]
MISSALKEKVRRLPDGPGVYLMKDRFGRVLYVGKAKGLKKRVSTYFQPSRKQAVAQPKVAAMLDLIYDFDIIEVRSEQEALLLEGKLIKQYKPKYNTDFTDNKQFLLVRVDIASELPRFRLTRNRLEDGARYFGPFAHSGLLRKTLAEMRRRFGILLGDAKPKRLEDDRWLLYDDARAEIYEQTTEVTTEEYHQRVATGLKFLEGKTREWVQDLEDEMQKAASEHRFEKAAQLRDVMFALKKTLHNQRTFTREPRVAVPGADEAADQLKEALGLRRPPRTLECFDISHISGSFVVASMVRFAEGRPDKNNYRRYRIKSFIGNDDYRAMEEVVGRRYRRLHEEEKAFPDIVVIDGGVGQVRAALKAFLVLDLEPPMMFGLAKREETIVFADDREPIQLPTHSPALHLLQRLRDEAHRFANTFNAELRSKKIRESVLDDFEGLGPVRREALLEHFRSFDRLRGATVEQLQAAPGIGPKLASQLHNFLHPKVTGTD